jgi:hypothetical protein
VAEALATAVVEALAEAFGEGVGVGVVFGVGEADAVGTAATQLGVGVGWSRVRFAGVLACFPPSSKRAAGTTSRPRMTVTTNARAPHSWSQKARDELRIRVRRPVPAGVCSGY